jgi:hypothetical protein
VLLPNLTAVLRWTVSATPWPRATEMVDGFDGLDWEDIAGPFESRREAINLAARCADRGEFRTGA